MGFRTEGIIQAILFPLLLTMILFLGPFVSKGFAGQLKLGLGSKLNVFYNNF